jgi:hypothetical protein
MPIWVEKIQPVRGKLTGKFKLLPNMFNHMTDEAVDEIQRQTIDQSQKGRPTDLGIFKINEETPEVSRRTPNYLPRIGIVDERFNAMK